MLDLSVAAGKRRKSLVSEAARSRASMLRWRVALYSVVIYNLVGLADVVSTTIALSSGAGYEANPFIRTLMEEIGNGWIAAKFALQLVITAMVLYFPHWIVLGFFITATVWNGIVVHNNFVIGGVL